LLNYKKSMVCLLIFLLLLMPVVYASDGDYTIPSARVDVEILNDTTVIVTEEINQNIEGTVNGVFRDIPLVESQSITNVSVDTPGYYNTVELISSNNKARIKVWLYKDEGKTQKVNNANVKVIYHYTFNKAVKIHNDIAELQLKTWGSQWESSVDKLETNIILPATNEDTEYWTSPPTQVQSSQWVDDHTLRTVLENVPSNQYIEQRILIPKQSFSSYDNAIITNVDAKDAIEKMQKKYLDDLEFHDFIDNVLSFIMALLLIVPVGIYWLYGREPKIDYKADYEVEPPTDDSALFVNNIVVGDVGEFDVNAFNATLLSLIDRKYYTIISTNDNDTVIRRTDKSDKGLKEYEIDILNHMNYYALSNGDISLNSIRNSDAEYFKSFIADWKDHANEEISKSRIAELFDDKGGNMMKIMGILLFVLGLIFMVYVLISDSSMTVIILSVLMMVIGLTVVFLPNTVGGRWTVEGREYHDKWINFKNYLEDYSLIEEYPPASVQVWGKYLVYATALGCAKEVSENMIKYFDSINMSDDYYHDNSIVYFGYYGGFYHMDSFNHLSTVSSDSSSDIGSVGGGFGGGGGGTF